ncbi:MAG: hypothetical protein N2323_07830, partial [candidate division WOR-3 bacterium]|nr:hypothetical protein [candidate division WOR-3 bacterium]
NIKNELKKIFEELVKDKVKLVFFKENLNIGNSLSIEGLLKEISELNPNILLEVYNKNIDIERTSEYEVERTPAIFIETPETGK